LLRSANAQVERLVVEAEAEAQHSAQTATLALRLILGTTFAGVAGFAIVGSRIERQAGARRASTRLDARFQAIVENLREFVLIVDDEGNLRYISPSVESELAAGLPSTNMSDLLERASPASQEAFARLLAAPESSGTALLEAVDSATCGTSRRWRATSATTRTSGGWSSPPGT
jgi:PAS domain-containing protein